MIADNTPNTATEATNSHDSDKAGLRVKLKDYFHPDSGDSYYFAWAAGRLHFGIRFENIAADDQGTMCVEMTLYEDLPTVDCADVDAWWPTPRGWTARQRERVEDEDLWDAMHDSRWEEEHAQALMLRVRHTPGCCVAARGGRWATRQEWFVEFSGMDLAADLDYQSFPHREVYSNRG